MTASRLRAAPRHARTLHIEILDDELCIYDWATERVHALNPAAARVWRLCDGIRSPRQIAEVLASAYGARAPELVAAALSELSAAGLLESDVAIERSRVSRRDLVKRLGVTAAMLPVVSSIVAPSKVHAASANPQTFNFTGAAQTFVVPAGVALITVDAFGAAGGMAVGGALHGLGGRATATILVTPGESLTVFVGGAGATNFPDCGVGGFNGGGMGNSAFGGGGGGGASDVRRSSTKLVVAGGGGGGGRSVQFPSGPAGGAGGGLIAGAGLPTEPGGPNGGTGGSQSAGGSGGGGVAGGAAGSDGTSGTGGSGGGGGPLQLPVPGCAAATFLGGAGGGGGYFGGGGGGGNFNGQITLTAGGGGGGSSYTNPAATDVSHVAGVRSGHGQIVIFS